MWILAVWIIFGIITMFYIDLKERKRGSFFSDGIDIEMVIVFLVFLAIWPLFLVAYVLFEELF
jgi:hypothetical protein